ncbi:MAG: flavodoxin domain-containing protein [Bacteroidales bacterium]|jgi:flavodoxin|nr:flavodoxin domain-containing protein [Bacteroidales bacterium]
MKKAVIIYNSKTGITKKYAQEIGAYLKLKELEVTILSIQEYRAEILNNVDYLLLGCWTSGLMFFLQHPEKDWNDFAAKLPNAIKSKIALFTTYKILTGSMFNKMRKQLNGRVVSCLTEIKSRNGMLSENNKIVLDDFVN